MIDFVIPERHDIYIELKPYFDVEETMLDMNDEELVQAYSEMQFLKYSVCQTQEESY